MLVRLHMSESVCTAALGLRVGDVRALTQSRVTRLADCSSTLTRLRQYFSHGPRDQK